MTKRRKPERGCGFESTCQTLMVRSAATPRVPNHEAVDAIGEASTLATSPAKENARGERALSVVTWG
jgi:hypothetical protein